MQEDSPALKIPVRSEALEYVCKFCQYHKENPKMVSRFTKDGPIDHFIPFDKTFSLELREKPEVLFYAIAAADYLDQTKLLDVLCRSAAMLLYCQNEQQIREKFRLFPTTRKAKILAVCSPLLNFTALNRHPEDEPRSVQGAGQEAPVPREVQLSSIFAPLAAFPPHFLASCFFYLALRTFITTTSINALPSHFDQKYQAQDVWVCARFKKQPASGGLRSRCAASLRRPA